MLFDEKQPTFFNQFLSVVSYGKDQENNERDFMPIRLKSAQKIEWKQTHFRSSLKIKVFFGI